MRLAGEEGLFTALRPRHVHCSGALLFVTAYQSASGLVNLATPTSAVIMGGLALSKVSYDRDSAVVR